MGGKKKKGGKKGKKKEKEPPKEPSEFEPMDTPTLKEAIAAMRIKLEKVALDRNYVQLERVRVGPRVALGCVCGCCGAVHSS